MKRENNRKKLIKIIAFTFCAGFLVYLFIPNYLKLEKYRESREVLNNRIKQLEEQNENLRMEIAKLQSDSLYIEKIARKELRMMKPGETIYRIEEEDTNVSELNR
jgi:cell division protein FtsB